MREGGRRTSGKLEGVSEAGKGRGIRLRPCVGDTGALCWLTDGGGETKNEGRREMRGRASGGQGRVGTSTEAGV